MSNVVKGPYDYYAEGDWNAACSMCGFKFKASLLVKNWQGMYRCPKCNEARHPQDFVRAVPDHVAVPWAQPETDIDVGICTYNGISGIPGWAYPGCAIPGRTIVDPSLEV